MIRGARHVIAVPNLRDTARYFADVLGFHVKETGDPGWCFFVRDRCFIMAGQCADALAPRDLGDHSYFAYLEVDDADELYAELEGRGAELLSEPTSEPWGMREFGVRTPDGHRIRFGSPIRDA